MNIFRSTITHEWDSSATEEEDRVVWITKANHSVIIRHTLITIQEKLGRSVVGLVRRRDRNASQQWMVN